MAGRTLVQERAEKRERTLRRMVRDGSLNDVLDATETLWRDGESPARIRLRAAYTRNARKPDVELDERRRPPVEAMPRFAQLLVSQGVAMQFHLTALFAAQCTTAPGRYWRNTIPLDRRQDDAEVTWLELVASPAGSGRDRDYVSGHTANKLRQFRAALATLSRKGLVGLGQSVRGRRYDGFELLTEGRRNTRAGASRYKVPLASEACLPVPREFFTRGWVHVLTKSETAAYLMWLHQGAATTYVTVGWETRAGLYGLGQDVYDTHQALAAFGLLEVERPEGRRDNGTWRGYGRGSTPRRHRVRAVPDALAQDPLRIVPAALRKCAALGTWSRPLDRSHPLARSGSLDQPPSFDRTSSFDRSVNEDTPTG
ncbi:hypothetical protein [Streptomyces sp. A012304]|uniref:hypothetical protein n=1 Tax=Streptomyces sp. A012304 TaxID=375446 RepID=UPI00222F066A|nr:hypothetical protein [Streptomyces sp. A012304]GKQ36900.1 hypothetical protein ALMP_34400 [Streptomyces sp. A012304]